MARLRCDSLVESLWHCGTAESHGHFFYHSRSQEGSGQEEEVVVTPHMLEGWHTKSATPHCGTGELELDGGRQRGRKVASQFHLSPRLHVSPLLLLVLVTMNSIVIPLLGDGTTIKSPGLGC